jgi:hypothetical protein
MQLDPKIIQDATDWQLKNHQDTLRAGIGVRKKTVRDIVRVGAIILGAAVVTGVALAGFGVALAAPVFTWLLGGTGTVLGSMGVAAYTMAPGKDQYRDLERLDAEAQRRVAAAPGLAAMPDAAPDALEDFNQMAEGLQEKITVKAPLQLKKRAPAAGYLRG